MSLDDDIHFQLEIPANKKFFTVGEIPNLTAGAIWPEPEFNDSPSDMNKIEVEQAHERFLSDAIDNGEVRVFDPILYLKMPIDAEYKDTRAKENLVSQMQFIEFARSLGIETRIANEPVEITPDLPHVDEKEISGKSETAYLHIIGALVDLYWRAAKPGQTKINQSEIIAALETYRGFAGLSERNLKDKLSKAIKAVLNE
ncbi:hypothetical protein [Collimonas sp. OK412]|uniref:hypothetical protein n=1 Tax=Collimonas sp. (strain OK412) TaxID=1801619 RepID=UPI0008ED59C9|nr:hypothetical protein [Collimonas sp. OK412]SFC62271.1 hypothetical protein SAMN04515619_11081 [Collimonas sp. OK412]